MTMGGKKFSSREIFYYSCERNRFFSHSCIARSEMSIPSNFSLSINNMFLSSIFSPYCSAALRTITNIDCFVSQKQHFILAAMFYSTEKSYYIISMRLYFFVAGLVIICFSVVVVVIQHTSAFGKGRHEIGITVT